MKFIISGKNIEVTEGIKAAIEEKLGRLDKYLVDDTIVNVTLSVQKGRQKIEDRSYHSYERAHYPC